jgi:hypothetical protein
VALAVTLVRLFVTVAVYVLVVVVMSEATTWYDPTGRFSIRVAVFPASVIALLNLFGPVTVTLGMASAVNPVIFTSSLPMVAGCAGQAVMMLASTRSSTVETIRMGFLRECRLVLVSFASSNNCNGVAGL